MIDIEKGKEPPRLTDYRGRPDADWEGPRTDDYTFSDIKSDLRVSMVREQHHLCAYCMRQIENDPLTTKIEHVYPRNRCKSGSGREYLKLTYENLVLCCLGKAGESCCDSRKSLYDTRETLSFSPVLAFSDAGLIPMRGIERYIGYTSEGEVVVESDELGDTERKRLNYEITTILGLNAPLLKELRVRVYRACMRLFEMAKKRHQDTPAYYERHLARLRDNRTEAWQPFMGVYIYVIKRRIKSLSKRLGER